MATTSQRLTALEKDVAALKVAVGALQPVPAPAPTPTYSRLIPGGLFQWLDQPSLVNARNPDRLAVFP